MHWHMLPLTTCICMPSSRFTILNDMIIKWENHFINTQCSGSHAEIIHCAFWTSLISNSIRILIGKLGDFQSCLKRWNRHESLTRKKVILSFPSEEMIQAWRISPERSCWSGTMMIINWGDFNRRYIRFKPTKFTKPAKRGSFGWLCQH